MCADHPVLYFFFFQRTVANFSSLTHVHSLHHLNISGCQLSLNHASEADCVLVCVFVFVFCVFVCVCTHSQTSPVYSFRFFWKSNGTLIFQKFCQVTALRNLHKGLHVMGQDTTLGHGTMGQDPTLLPWVRTLGQDPSMMRCGNGTGRSVSVVAGSRPQHVHCRVAARALVIQATWACGKTVTILKSTLCMYCLLLSKCTRALTFENLLQGRMRSGTRSSC